MDPQDFDRHGHRFRRLRTALETILPKSRLSRNALVASSGHLTGYAVMLLATPLLTRLYSVADFGVFTIYTTLLTLVAFTGTLRYEGAIPLPAEDVTSRRLLVLAAVICCLTSLAASLLLGLLGRVLLLQLKAEELADYWLLFALQLWAIGWGEALAGWMIRRGTFGLMAQSRFLLCTTTALGQLAGAFLWDGPKGLILGAVAGCVVGLGYLLVGLRRELPSLREVRLGELWAVAVRYRRFPIYSVPSCLIQRATLLLPPLALAVLYNQTVVGWFGKGQQLLIVPLSLVGVPLSRVYMGEASRILREGTGSLRRLFARTLRKQLLLAGVPLGLFALVAPWVFEIALGRNWREAGVYCGLLCPMLILYTTNVVLATTLEVLERLELQLRRSLVCLACISAGICLPAVFTMGPRGAILAFSLTNSVGYLYTLWTTWHALPAEPPVAASAAVPAHHSPPLPVGASYPLRVKSHV